MSFTRLGGVIGLVFLSNLTSGAAHAVPQFAGRTPVHLSAQALRQIDALEHEADARTPAQLKLDSQLLYTVKMARGEQIAPGISTLATSAVVNSQGMTLVDIDTDVTPNVLYAITRAGGTVVYSSPRWKSIRASVPLLALETLAQVPGVRFIKRPSVAYTQNPAPRPKKMDFLAPFVLPQKVSLSQRTASLRVQLPGLLARVDAIPGAAVPAVGSVTDEADKTHQADRARSTFHVDGTGIKVGVLSDSIDNFKDGGGAYADAVNSGDVSPVSVISGQQGGSDGEGEGLAMLEAVHHLAPGSPLYFATGAGSDASFADNIIALQKAGCKVIIDDEFSGGDSPFQDGIVSQAINQVTAAGVMYFSCAANYGNLTDGTASVWEGDFKDSGDRSFGDGAIHTFDSTQGVDGEGNLIDSHGQKTHVELFWSDPLGKSSNDYDLIILDSNFNVVGASTNRQTGSQDPYEDIDAGDGDYVDIVKHSGSTRYLHLNLDTKNTIFNYVTNGRVSGHNATANAFCVAATPAADAQTYSDTGNPIPGSPTGPYPNPFNSSNEVEIFSADGGRHVFYDPSGKAYTSSLTHTGGKVLVKPEFTAADGTSSTLPLNDGLNPFFGTSCAAPHAGAIAALVLSYNKTLTRAQLATILENSATNIMTSGIDNNAGYGILNAYKALQNTPAPTSVTVSSLSFTPNPVTSGQTATGTIKLSGPAPSGGAAVDIKVNGSDLGTTPVAAGSTSGTFTLSFTVTASTNYTVTATYGGKTVSTTLTVNPASAPPTISSLSPSSANAGGPAFTLTVNGTNFVSGSLVKWNGATQTTTFVSSTKLTASISASLITTAGTASVTVTTPHVGTSASKTFTINAVTSAAPVLSSISPTTRTAGGGAFVLTANGSSFRSDSLIKWNGATQTTTFVSSTKLTASIPASLIASAGTASITVTTPHVGTSGAKTLIISGGSSVTAYKLAFSPASISSNGQSTGTVTLSAAAPSGGAAVRVSHQSSFILTATVAAGSTTAALRSPSRPFRPRRSTRLTRRTGAKRRLRT